MVASGWKPEPQETHGLTGKFDAWPITSVVGGTNRQPVRDSKAEAMGHPNRSSTSETELGRYVLMISVLMKSALVTVAVSG